MNPRSFKRSGEFPPAEAGVTFAAPTSTLGSLHRELRVKAGQSRSVISRRTGIAHQMIESFECNRVPPPSYSQVCALAPLLGIDDEDLLERAGYVRRADR